MSLDPNHARALQAAIGALILGESHLRHLCDFCLVEPGLLGQVSTAITALKEVQAEHVG